MSSVLMFVNGQAMSGGSLNYAFSDARFCGKVRTSTGYRFYSVRDEFPGLIPVESGESGYRVHGELYEISYAELRDRVLPNEPAELELTAIRLDDDSGALSMKLRHDVLGSRELTEIGEVGDWHKYLEARAGRSRV